MHAVMYMVRHSTMLPVTNRVVARSEDIPEGYLAKIMQRLANANIVTSSKTAGGGYLFARPPETISVLEILQTIESSALFEECFMKHCDCNATPDSCDIYRKWLDATRELKEALAQTYVTDVAWTHPEHRFDSGRRRQQVYARGNRQSDESKRKPNNGLAVC